MLDNGEQITFENGNLEDYKNKISVGDVLVDGSIIGDINEVVLHDREMLSQDGAIIVSAALDIVKKKVVSEPVIEMKGFILNNNGNELSKEMIDLVNKELLKISASKKVDLTAIRNNIKGFVSQVCIAFFFMLLKKLKKFSFFLKFVSINREFRV